MWRGVGRHAATDRRTNCQMHTCLFSPQLLLHFLVLFLFPSLLLLPPSHTSLFILPSLLLFSFPPFFFLENFKCSVFTKCSTTWRCMPNTICFSFSCFLRKLLSSNPSHRKEDKGKSLNATPPRLTGFLS